MSKRLSAVIPGRREAAGPETRATGILFWSGFRARAHSASKTRVNALVGAPRNDTVSAQRRKRIGRAPQNVPRLAGILVHPADQGIGVIELHLRPDPADEGHVQRGAIEV